MEYSEIFKLLPGPVVIERVKCSVTNVSVEGEFEPPLLLQLNSEQQRLVELLVIHGGNLKKVAEDVGLSYPTLKLRLDELSRLFKEKSDIKSQARNEVLSRLDSGEITADQAIKLMRNL